MCYEIMRGGAVGLPDGLIKINSNSTQQALFFEYVLKPFFLFFYRGGADGGGIKET